MRDYSRLVRSHLEFPLRNCNLLTNQALCKSDTPALTERACWGNHSSLVRSAVYATPCSNWRIDG